MTAKLRWLWVLVVMSILGSGCGESFQLIWREKKFKPERQAKPAPNFQLAVVDYPTSSTPRIVVQVRRQKFWVATAKRMRMQFKKFDSGKMEPVPESQQTRKKTYITGETEWVAAPGMTVSFKVGAEGKETQSQTDSEGKASFDVSSFAEEWIEGKSLSVEVKATLKTLGDPDPWTKVKGKPLSALKIYKIRDAEVGESVAVDMRTLQSIFDRR